MNFAKFLKTPLVTEKPLVTTSGDFFAQQKAKRETKQNKNDFQRRTCYKPVTEVKLELLKQPYHFAIHFAGPVYVCASGSKNYYFSKKFCRPTKWMIPATLLKKRFWHRCFPVEHLREAASGISHQEITKICSRYSSRNTILSLLLNKTPLNTVLKRKCYHDVIPKFAIIRFRVFFQKTLFRF